MIWEGTWCGRGGESMGAVDGVGGYVCDSCRGSMGERE